MKQNLNSAAKHALKTTTKVIMDANDEKMCEIVGTFLTGNVETLRQTGNPEAADKLEKFLAEKFSIQKMNETEAETEVEVVEEKKPNIFKRMWNRVVKMYNDAKAAVVRRYNAVKAWFTTKKDNAKARIEAFKKARAEKKQAKAEAETQTQPQSEPEAAVAVVVNPAQA